MRARSLAVVMSLVAAACGPNGPGTEGSASTTSAESSGGDPTGESEETSTATEETTGDGDGDSWPECVSVNEVFGFEFSMAPLPETTSTRQCTVTSVGMTIFELDCPTQDLPEDLYEFKLAAAAKDDHDALPLTVGQTVTLLASPVSFAIRDDSSRLLVFAYSHLYAYEDSPNGLMAQDIAPLGITFVDGLCPSGCEEPPSLGVPPDCNCSETLGVDVSMDGQPGTTRILSGDMAAVPGGYVAVASAYHEWDCFDSDRDWLSLIYIVDPI